MGESKRKKKAAAAAPGEGAVSHPAAQTEAAPPEAPSANESAAQEPPLSGAPLPLFALEADWLGGFLELCFADQRLVGLCRELKITTPGYRLEALPPEQVARVLADEYRAAEDVRAPLEQAVREALRSPLFDGRALGREQLGEILEDVLDVMVTGDPLQQLARIAWAALLEPLHAGGAAKSAIDEGLRALEAPVRPGPKKAATLDEKAARKEVEAARRALEEMKKRAERAERERDSLQRQLAEQRGETAEREQRLAEERSELARLRAEQVSLRAELTRLTAAGDGRALADLRRAEAEARGLTEKLARSEEARAQAEQRLASLEKQPHEAPRAPAPLDAEGEGEGAEELPSEEEAQSFLLPVFTREFYDSIDRWSRRMQRAAFDKIHRLAEDWRHGSLRALALGGLPGYYRIRVATDVRLIYRRDGNQLEILSLIDREDLDRYIRQARTR